MDHTGSRGGRQSQLVARQLTVLGHHEFESGGRSGGGGGNRGRGENETAGPVHQEIDQRPRASDETAGSPQRLAQGSHANLDPPAQSQLRCEAPAFRPHHSGAVGLVEHEPSPVVILEFDQFGQRGRIPIHGKDALGDHQDTRPAGIIARQG